MFSTEDQMLLQTRAADAFRDPQHRHHIEGTLVIEAFGAALKNDTDPLANPKVLAAAKKLLSRDDMDVNGAGKLLGLSADTERPVSDWR